MLQDTTAPVMPRQMVAFGVTNDQISDATLPTPVPIWSGLKPYILANIALNKYIDFRVLLKQTRREDDPDETPHYDERGFVRATQARKKDPVFY